MRREAANSCCAGHGVGCRRCKAGLVAGHGGTRRSGDAGIDGTRMSLRTASDPDSRPGHVADDRRTRRYLGGIFRQKIEMAGISSSAPENVQKSPVRLQTAILASFLGQILHDICRLKPQFAAVNVCSDTKLIEPRSGGTISAQDHAQQGKSISTLWSAAASPSIARTGRLILRPIREKKNRLLRTRRGLTPSDQRKTPVVAGLGDLQIKQKYLVTFTVGYEQRANIDACVKKFSENFTILLFHYDGRTSEWDEFEWSRRAIHVSARKQTKWWYAKRFLHPDIVAAYDYIFIWDEDLGVEHFNAERYVELVRKHGLEISQPGLEPNKGLTWQMTKRRGDREVHKVTEERPGWCSDPHLPPCAAFVEIMAPVFSRDAWRCVWHMIQNDLVHGWGLDFALRKCVHPAHEKIGVVDSQWIVHQVVPSLGNQGQAKNGKAAWEGVRERCRSEWTMFQGRMAEAERDYFTAMGLPQPNSSTAS
ncbi:hypothetical protein EJ110_NYTH14569 [Nymphaea thermarum]|nr:hypothetical protein EJ110_NYTH14569 [Nymphaea thermarum]